MPGLGKPKSKQGYSHYICCLLSISCYFCVKKLKIIIKPEGRNNVMNINADEGTPRSQGKQLITPISLVSTIR